MTSTSFATRLRWKSWSAAPWASAPPASSASWSFRCVAREAWESRWPPAGASRRSSPAGRPSWTATWRLVTWLHGVRSSASIHTSRSPPSLFTATTNLRPCTNPLPSPPSLQPTVDRKWVGSEPLTKFVPANRTAFRFTVLRPLMGTELQDALRVFPPPAPRLSARQAGWPPGAGDDPTWGIRIHAF